MNKRIISMVLVALMLAGFAGCGKAADNESDTVSYLTTYEEYYEEGESKTETGEDTASTGKKTGGKTAEVKAGDAKIDVQASGTVDGLNFGGKTFTKTIIGSVTQSLMRRKAQFEKDYNCTIKLVSLQWEQYNSQVATAMASGNPYDICGLQSFFWPEAGVQGLYEPLNKYISKEDLYDSKTGVGIDLDVSGEFVLNGNIYGVSNHEGSYASMLQVLFYNKLMFKEAGLEDPLALYQKGQWTWDKLFEYAGKVKNASKGKYLVGQEFNATTFVLSNGFHYVKNENGKVKSNITDSLYKTSLDKYKEFMEKYAGPNGYSDDPTEFYNGNYYMFNQVYSYGYMYMYDTIVSSSAFNNDFSNLGVVPFPYGPNNTSKTNPGHGGQAKAAGKGSKDPRIVIAWTKYEREWKDPMLQEDPHRYSDEITKVISSLFDNVNNSMANYKTSSQNARTLVSKIENEAKKGGDYVKAIADNSATIQSIINDSLKQ